MNVSSGGVVGVSRYRTQHFTGSSESATFLLPIEDESLKNLTNRIEDLLIEREEIARQMGKLRYDTGETATFDPAREDYVR